MKNGDKSKTYELLKTSWTYQTQEYFDNSTLHGVRYIKEDGRPFCEKFMWFCFTSIGGVVTLIIIVSLWEKFQTNPTITGLDTDFHNWDVPFPTVSLCPENPVNMSAVKNYVHEKWPLEYEDMRTHYETYIKQVANISYYNLNLFEPIKNEIKGNLPTDYNDIINKVAIKCEELFSECSFKAEKVECCDVLQPLLTEVGYCLTFNSMYAVKDKAEPFVLKHIHETDHKWSLTMDIDSIKDGKLNPIRVYLHSTHDFPVIDVNPQHVWDRKIHKIAFGSKQTYTTEGAKQLTIKQRKCVFDDEIKLVTSDVYTYRSCMIQCRMKLARDICKCVPFFYRKLGGFNYCDLGGLKCLGNIKEKLLTLNCPCELGCSNAEYEVEKLVEDIEQKETKTLEVAFISWPMVRYKREVLFGWVDLLVSFGGIAGLFLGFSLLSGVEFFYYFTMRALCMVYREKEDLYKLQEEYEKAEKPPLDLRLTPMFMRKKETNILNNATPAAPIMKVQPGNYPLPTTVKNVQPVSTITNNINNKDPQHFLKPVYAGFEFLP